MGSDESHFNISLFVRDKVTRLRQCPYTNHNLFEEKGEPPKRNRTEVLLASLTPYRWAKPAHKTCSNKHFSTWILQSLSSACSDIADIFHLCNHITATIEQNPFSFADQAGMHATGWQIAKAKRARYRVCFPAGWVLLYVRRNAGLLGTGVQDGHLDFHAAPELCFPAVMPWTSLSLSVASVRYAVLKLRSFGQPYVSTWRKTVDCTMMMWSLMSSDVGQTVTNCDQCVCMAQFCFTSTETGIRLIKTGIPGRPPRLSHSSWTP